MAAKTNPDQRESRRAAIAAMVKGGVTQREIAQTLNVSLGTVNRDIKLLRKQWAQEQHELDEEFTLDIQRLNDMIGAVYAAASRGHLPAVDTLLKVLDRRARMLGYDAPGKIETDLTSGGEPLKIAEVRIVRDQTAPDDTRNND